MQMGPVTFRLALILLLAAILVLVTAVFRYPGRANWRVRLGLEGAIVILGTALVLLAPARVPFTHTLTGWLDTLRHAHGLSPFEAIAISALAALVGALLSWRPVLAFLVAPLVGTIAFILCASLVVPTHPGAPPLLPTLVYYAPFFLVPPAYLVTWLVGIPAHFVLRRLDRAGPLTLVVLFGAVGGTVAILLGTWIYLIPLTLGGLVTGATLAASLRPQPVRSSMNPSRSSSAVSRCEEER
ncbi:MAG: hypothetical protein ACM3NS_01460 [Deltaproteobacteria bacterium]